VATLDGSATGPDGRAGTINNAADKLVFDLLRALADVVLVGAGTVAAEAYRPIELNDEQRRIRASRGLDGVPTLAVVTRSLRLPDQLLDAAGREGMGDLVVLCPRDADLGRSDELRDRLGPSRVVAAGDVRVSPIEALAALRDRGLRQVLCEGGPTLLSTVVEERALDELCLTWTPLMVGGTGPRILDGGPISTTWRLEHLLEDDGTIMGRWLRAS
jgi:riboflavin biosynthesis pyrimidine reductase